MEAKAGGSIGFDRAADYYDRTRVLSPEAASAQTEVLRSELAGRGRCLEIGVGTGRIALPLAEAGISMAGVDLSAAMLGKLLEKAGTRPPFPLVRGDATALPFADAAFAAGLASHVFHLVSAWRVAVDELARVVRPGGVVLVNIGGDTGPSHEISERFAAEVDLPSRNVGIDWSSWDALDQAFEKRGARPRTLRPIVGENTETLDEVLRGIEQGLWSWTWRVPEERRLAALPVIRAWAERRFGPLEAPREHRFEIIWRAYDLP